MKLENMTAIINAFADLSPKGKTTARYIMRTGRVDNADVAVLRELQLKFFPFLILNTNTEEDRVLRFQIMEIDTLLQTRVAQMADVVEF